MQAIPDSTQSDSLAADKKDKKKKPNKKKKRKTESKDSTIVKRKKTGKGKKKSSAKSNDKQHKSGKASPADGDPDMDISVELKPIGDYIKDREEMLGQMFACIQQDRLTAMLPNILKNVPLEEVKALCLTELEGMSKKRIRYIIAGREMDSSSGTEESDSDAEPQARSDDNEGANSPVDQVPHSTVNLQVGDNQSEHSVESPGGAEHRSSAEELDYADDEEVVYQSDLEYAEEEIVEGEAGYRSDNVMEEEEEVEDCAPIYNEEEQDMIQDDTDERYDDLNAEEETECINEGEMEQPEDDDVASQKSHSEIENGEDSENSGMEDLEGEEEQEGEETGDEIQMDVPKRMRKDVEEGDIEDGEVFDDDEDEDEEEASSQSVLSKDGDEISAENRTSLGTVEDVEVDRGDAVETEAECEVVQCATSNDKSSENVKLLTESHEGAAEHGKGDTLVQGEVDAMDQGKPDNVQGGKHESADYGKGDTLEHGTDDTSEHGDSDTLEQGKHNSIDLDEDDTLEQGNGDTLEHGKVDTLEHGKVDTLEQGKHDIVDHGEGDTLEQGKKEVTLEQGNSCDQQNMATVEYGRCDKKQEKEITCGSTTVNDNTKECLQKSMKCKNTLAKVESEQEQAQGSDPGEHTELSCVNRTSGPDLTRDKMQTSLNESAVAIEINAKPLSGGVKDNPGIYGDSSRKADIEEAGGYTEPASSSAAAIVCNSTSQAADESNAKADNSATKENTQCSVEGEDTAGTRSVAMDTAEKADTANVDSDRVSSSASDSDSGSDSDNSNSDSSEEEEQPTDNAVNANSKAQPATDELEMLELELRARAIRSLMKKMGKE